MYVGIRDYVEERTSGRAFQHMVEVQVEDLPTLRSQLQKKFAKATPALIRRMEQEFDAGLPGIMSKASKALSVRVYGLRNRIEDQEVMLKYCNSLEMAADLGTKLFSIRRFKFLRDLVNGYALVRASNRKVNLPVAVVTLSELRGE